MKSTPVIRTATVTADYAPISATPLVATVDISCPPANTAAVKFRGDDGSDNEWIPGENHRFPNVDLSTIYIKGTPGDKVTVAGYCGFTGKSEF
jgi:hypothetical protein